MRKYELTERGKIVIAGLVVVVLLVLSALLVVMALANQSSAPSNDDIGSLESASWSPPPGETAPVSTNSPPPDGGDFTPPDILLPSDDGNPGSGGDNVDQGEQGEIIEQSEPPPPGIGPTGGNPSDGTLSFLFSPVHQTQLDVETASLLDALLSSPGNTPGSAIVVETPVVDEDYAEILMAAVTYAFTARGVEELRIVRAIRAADTATGETFEVFLYFIPASEK